MEKREYEEYRSGELSQFSEMKIFEAEDYRNFEYIRGNVETFKTIEIEERRNVSSPTYVSNQNTNKNITDTLKQGIKMLGSTVTTAAVAVSAVVVGVVPVSSNEEIDTGETDVVKIDVGEIEVLNYYVDYNLKQTDVENDIVIKFTNDLEEGYYYVVKNTQTSEVQYPNYDYVRFSDIGNENVMFEIIVLDEEETEMDKILFSVDPKASGTYLGLGQLDYDVIVNEDGSHDLKLYLEDSVDLELNAFLKDLEGNYLEYESSYSDNVITISNVKEKEFDIIAGAYRLENGNYYSEKSYKLNSFNVEKTSFVDLERVEILNMTYTIDYETIPTMLYFGGYLTANDSLEVVVVGENGEELERVSDVRNLGEPIVFNGLPTDQNVNFKYSVCHRESVLLENNHEVTLFTPEEYQDIDYSFYTANPGDGLITYNDDYTYNYYVLSGFENKSEYDLIYKYELVTNMIPKYEYIGTDAVAEIVDIAPNEYYSLVYKVMVRDGKNYYVISDFYLASGSVGFEYIEGEESSILQCDIYSNEDKTYTVSSYMKIGGDVEVEVILSTNEILNYKFSADEVGYGAVIDLTEYEYESLTIKVKISGNPNYGYGDMILETKTEYKGKLFIEFIKEYSE